MKVKLFANFREICLDKVVEVPSPDGSSVIQVLEDLIKLYPAMDDEVFDHERKLKPFVHVFINGRNIIHLDGLNTPVSGEDQFALFPPVAGG
ncbi:MULTISPECIES: ubiquitin-like small modifier protein 1 [Paenibacillus]|uniref:MoaD family protein n=1 Tax=Paenibacillus naphthalenovorans TaxID=162209 RepID=A0A0U2UM23_9BACL|nr:MULTISPECIES: ubiquitin-like small modifier protein 1 [Paenibacillus]ALS22993.1 MoaD family protein [Paenibacillus naphthalenovorans]NTZ17411.1 MoaD/ThiS family protein [Paenibacillus sp. JMULE4]GCL71946.1 MoaD/ThiS family protein [Paenibacillus naphthalenovorans]SDI43302.1 molybdopterin synthase sulfur carrier subunit [Paenibacillus naphthalenovorans]